MKKYLLIIILILIIGLIMPDLAYAKLPVIDLISSALDGIEEKVGPIMFMLFQIIFAYIIGIIVLFIAIRLLEWIVLGQIEWINFGEESMVAVGFDFTSGLANIFIILMLLIIAFATILKIENYQAKKLLPKLIIVALLLNFSLVFVGMVIDVSNILFQTVLGGNERLIGDVMWRLVVSSHNLITMIFTTFGTAIIGWAAPFIGIGYQIAVITGFIGVILPSIITWIPLIIVTFLMIIVLFSFVLLFSFRIFVLQILAILSPLAFLCYIWPSTKKYFDDWLKWFIEWAFMGVQALFFLLLGLAMANDLKPSENLPNFLPEELLIFSFDDLFIFYFFLAVYLILVLLVLRKTMPIGAQAIIDGAKSVGKIALPAAAGYVGTRAMNWAKNAAKKGDEAEKTIKEKEKTGGKAFSREWFAKRKLESQKGVGNWANRALILAGTTAGHERNKEINEGVAGLEKEYGKDVENALKVMASRFKFLTSNQKAACLAYVNKQKGAKGVDKFIDQFGDQQFRQTFDALPDHMIEDIVKNKPDLTTNSNTAHRVQRVMFSKGFKKDENGKYEKDLQTLIDLKIKINGEGIEEILASGNETKITQVKQEVLYKKIFGELNSEDIKNLTSKIINDENWQKMAAKYMSPNLLIKMAETHGPSAANKIIEQINKGNINEIARINSGMLKIGHTSGGQAAGLATFKDLEGKKRIQQAKQQKNKQSNTGESYEHGAGI